MKATELREKSIAELNQHLDGLYREQFNNRMQKATGQLGQVHLLRAVRQEIARVKTLITEKEKSGS